MLKSQHHTRWSEDANAAAAVKTRSGRLVMGSEAAHHSNDDANAAITEFDRADGRLVVEAAAARHLHEDANAAAAETEQAESRLVAEATATYNRGDDTHAAAAASKEKVDRTEVMSRSQENMKRPMKETMRSEGSLRRGETL